MGWVGEVLADAAADAPPLFTPVVLAGRHSDPLVFVDLAVDVMFMADMIVNRQGTVTVGYSTAVNCPGPASSPHVNVTARSVDDEPLQLRRQVAAKQCKCTVLG